MKFKKSNFEIFEIETFCVLELVSLWKNHSFFSGKKCRISPWPSGYSRRLMSEISWVRISLPPRARRMPRFNNYDDTSLTLRLILGKYSCIRSLFITKLNIEYWQIIWLCITNSEYYPSHKNDYYQILLLLFIFNDRIKIHYSIRVGIK